MRLRHVGPGIGGLNYSPLLRNVRRSQPAATSALVSPPAAAAHAQAGRLGSFWRSLGAASRRMGQAVVDARMKEAERLIELEARRLAGGDGASFDHSAIGSRYY